MACKRVFFKLVHRRPTQQRRQARPLAAAGSLPGDLLARSNVECQEASAGQLRFGLSGVRGSLLQDRVSVVSYLHVDAMWLRDNLLARKDERKLECCIEGLPMEGAYRDTLHALMDGMLSNGVVGDSAAVYDARNERETNLLQ